MKNEKIKIDVPWFILLVIAALVIEKLWPGTFPAIIVTLCVYIISGLILLTIIVIIIVIIILCLYIFIEF